MSVHEIEESTLLLVSTRKQDITYPRGTSVTYIVSATQEALSRSG